MIIGCSTKNRENYPKKAFEQRIKETHIKILPWDSINQPLNEWAQHNRGIGIKKGKFEGGGSEVW